MTQTVCFSGLASSFAANRIATWIPVLLPYKPNDYSNRIKFTNAIMVDQGKNKGEKCLRYKMETWKEKGTFLYYENISEHVTLVQLMDQLSNVNNAVSLVGKWIFDSNHEKTYC